jgi:hypothetical protein
MDASSYHDIERSLRQLYLDDHRPLLVRFSGCKDSTMLASLSVEVVAGILDDQPKKLVAMLCTEIGELPQPLCLTANANLSLL